MLTLRTILREIKNVPVERLEELYSLIHSFNTSIRKSEAARKKILSFAGSFASMTENDYNDFIHETKKSRNELFNRDGKI